MAALTEALKGLAADSELEGEIVLCLRLEPFVEFGSLTYRRQPNMLGDKRGRASQAHHGGKGGGEMDNVGMIKNLEHPYLTPHALLTVLDFILRIGP